MAFFSLNLTSHVRMTHARAFESLSFGDPIGMLSCIKNGGDVGEVIGHAIVNPLGKPLCQKAMMMISLRMNTRNQLERIDVGADRIEKVSAESLQLPLVETDPAPQIPLR